MLKLIHSERNNQKINLSNQGGYIATFHSFWLIHLKNLKISLKDTDVFRIRFVRTTNENIVNRKLPFFCTVLYLQNTPS